MLQDTRTSKEAEKDCQKNSLHKIFFNSYASNARGVAIVVKDSCPITDVKTIIIVPGNLTKLNFTYKEEKYANKWILMDISMKIIPTIVTLSNER